MDRMMKVLVELNRMRQSEKLIGIIINALMMTYAENITMSVLSELEKLKLNLANYVDDPAARQNIVNELRVSLGNVFSGVAVNTLKQVQNQYPIAALQ
jgi:hypothetical protein